MLCLQIIDPVRPPPQAVSCSYGVSGTCNVISASCTIPLCCWTGEGRVSTLIRLNNVARVVGRGGGCTHISPLVVGYGRLGEKGQRCKDTEGGRMKEEQSGRGIHSGGFFSHREWAPTKAAFTYRKAGQ